MMMEDGSWIFRGPTKIVPTYGSLGEFFVTCLAKHGSKVAQVQQVEGQYKSHTFSDLLHQAKRVSAFLTKRGVKCGDTVWLCCGNKLAYAPILMGTIFIGAALAPVLHLYEEDNMLHMLGVIEPKLAICNQEAWPALSSANAKYSGNVPMVTLDDIVQEMEDAEEVKDFKLAHVADPGTHVALVMGSSGTTGPPKGVELTHKSFLSQVNTPLFGCVKDHSQLQQTVAINLSSPHWVSVSIGIITNLAHGITFILLEEFSVEEFLKTVQKFKVNHAFLKPPEVAALARSPLTEQYDTSSFHNIITGGAVINEAIRQLAERRLETGVYSLFGATEVLVPLKITFAVPDKRNNMGTLAANVEAKIIDTNSGQAVGPNCEGELCFRTPAIMKGYRNMPDATREVVDEDGFYHTGDLGYVDKEGLFYYADRIKERIRYIIYQFSAIEVETVLLSHPDIVDAAVVGVPHEEDTDHAVGFLVRRPGSTVSAEELATLLQDKLPWYKWLHGGIFFLDSLPRTINGKLFKRKLREHPLVKAAEVTMAV